MAVREPADKRRFNGVVLVEWYNVTNGFDAKGTVPLALFGPVGCGLRSGFSVRRRARRTASPLLLGLLMDHVGIGVLTISAGLSLSAFVALLLLKARPAAAPVPA